MVVETKYLTVRIEDVSGVGRNDGLSIFIVYKSGTMQTLVYGEGDQELGNDYRKLKSAMTTLEFPSR